MRLTNAEFFQLVALALAIIGLELVAVTAIALLDPW
jgi:hypothetical protein